MQLRAIMTPEVEVIHPEDTLQQAAAKMRRLNIGSLPVCEGERLIGMLTDRDITVRVVAEGCNPTTTTIREAMTPDIAYCFDDQGSKTPYRSWSAPRFAGYRFSPVTSGSWGWCRWEIWR